MADVERVEFGWRVPDFPTDGSQPGSFLEQVMEHLGVAEESAFASAWVADHFWPWAQWQSPETPTVECWTTLSYLAASYRRLRWGSVVLCQSYRNPALLAQMAAQLCWLAPGRVIFGIGAGWKDDEYRANGYAFPAAAARIAQLDEAVEIIRRLWTTPGAVSFEGEHYSVRDAHLAPKPDPLPPIMIGGGGERLTLRVVAKHADWYNLSRESLSVFRHKLGVLARHCGEIGRDPASIRKSWCCECVAIANSHAEAEQLAHTSPFYEPSNAIVGTPDEVAAAFQGWVDAGATHFQLRFADFPSLAGLRLFAKEVLPGFGAG